MTARTIKLADAQAMQDDIKAIMAETGCTFEQAVDRRIERRKQEKKDDQR